MFRYFMQQFKDSDTHYIMKVLIAFLFIALCLAAAPTYSVPLASKSIHLSSAIYNITKEQLAKGQCNDCYPGFKVLKQILGNNILSIVGVDPAIKMIVVVFRGSDNIKNFLTDARIKKHSYGDEKICKKCKLHAGFYTSYKKLTNQGLLDAIKQAVEAYPNYGILFTGHSLGGAVGVIAAVKFTEHHPTVNDVKVYTFGQPRAGNQQYSQYTERKIQHLFRVVHRKDIVPHKPAYIAGYRHSGFEIWYRDGMRAEPIGCESESNDCSNSVGFRNFNFVTKDHSSLNYIQLDDHSDHQEESHSEEPEEIIIKTSGKSDALKQKFIENENAAVIDETVKLPESSDMFEDEPDNDL